MEVNGMRAMCLCLLVLERWQMTTLYGATPRILYVFSFVRAVEQPPRVAYLKFYVRFIRKLYLIVLYTGCPKKVGTKLGLRVTEVK